MITVGNYVYPSLSCVSWICLISAGDGALFVTTASASYLATMCFLLLYMWFCVSNTTVLVSRDSRWLSELIDEGLASYYFDDMAMAGTFPPSNGGNLPPNSTYLLYVLCPVQQVGRGHDLQSQHHQLSVGYLVGFGACFINRVVYTYLVVHTFQFVVRGVNGCGTNELMRYTFILVCT